MQKALQQTFNHIQSPTAQEPSQLLEQKLKPHFKGFDFGGGGECEHEHVPSQ